MSVIHNSSIKFLQTIYSYKAANAQEIDVQVKFHYTRCLI